MSLDTGGDVSYFDSDQDGDEFFVERTFSVPSGPDAWSDVPVHDLESNSDLILAGLTGGDLLYGRSDPLSSLNGSSHAGSASTSSARPLAHTASSPLVELAELADLTHKELVALRSQSQQQSVHHQTHLRQFVKDNFAQTIQTIDAVRDVAVGVCEITKGSTLCDGDQSLASTYMALASSIIALDEQAEEAFRGYVQRVSLSENLGTVAQLFGAYDDLIILPGLMRGSVEHEDWEGFVRGYEKAVAELKRLREEEEGDSGATKGTSQIWSKLEEEVIKAAEGGVAALLGRIRSDTVPVSVQQAAEAACYLERVKRLDRLPLRNAQDVNVLAEFVESQVTRVMGVLRLCPKTSAVGDLVAISKAAMEWCREYWAMCERMDGVKKRDAVNAPFVELLIASEGHAETNTPRRVFSGYAEIVEDLVARRMRDMVTDPSAGCKVDQTTSALFDGLRSLVQEAEQLVAILVEVWDAWCADEDNTRFSLSPSGRTGLSSRSAASMALTVLVPLAPQIRDLFAHIIDDMFHVMGEYLRTRISTNVFSLRNRKKKDQAAAIGLASINSVQMNEGFLPRANVAFLRSAIREVMCCTASLEKQARLLRVPIRFKAHAYLKTVSLACSENIVQFVDGLQLSPTTGEREREQDHAQYVDEFILLAACHTLESIKTSVLPAIVTAHSTVLHIGNASATENSEAFKWCCTHLEDGQEKLMKKWVEIKLQKLEPIMDLVLDLSAPEDPDLTVDDKPDREPNPAIRDLRATLQTYDADISLMMPSLRDEVMGEMYLAVVEGMQNMVRSDLFGKQGPDARLQAWVDANAMKLGMVADLAIDDSDVEVLLNEVMEVIEADLHLEGSRQSSARLRELRAQEF